MHEVHEPAVDLGTQRCLGQSRADSGGHFSHRGAPGDLQVGAVGEDQSNVVAFSHGSGVRVSRAWTIGSWVHKKGAAPGLAGGRAVLSVSKLRNHRGRTAPGPAVRVRSRIVVVSKTEIMDLCPFGFFPQRLTHDLTGVNPRRPRLPRPTTGTVPPRLRGTGPGPEPGAWISTPDSAPGSEPCPARPGEWARG